MKVIGLCVVKNEADIVGYVLRDFLLWADYVSVLDNGSTDGTFELLTEMAHEFKGRFWLVRDESPFNEALRRKALESVMDKIETGDWLCRLDADEFYLPGTIKLLEKIALPQHVVYSVHAQFRFTELDFESNESRYTEPVHHRLKHYTLDRGEIRFFRYRRNLNWPIEAQWPLHIGLIAKAPVLVKHYQYRSPEQIKQRLAVRQESNKGGEYWWHGSPNDWRQFVSESKNCLSLNDNVLSNEGLEMKFDYREKPFRRVTKWILHTLSIWP